MSTMLETVISYQIVAKANRHVVYLAAHGRTKRIRKKNRNRFRREMVKYYKRRPTRTSN